MPKIVQFTKNAWEEIKKFTERMREMATDSDNKWQPAIVGLAGALALMSAVKLAGLLSGVIGVTGAFSKFVLLLAPVAIAIGVVQLALNSMGLTWKDAWGKLVADWETRILPQLVDGFHTLRDTMIAIGAWLTAFYDLGIKPFFTQVVEGLNINAEGWRQFKANIRMITTAIGTIIADWRTRASTQLKALLTALNINKLGWDVFKANIKAITTAISAIILNWRTRASTQLKALLTALNINKLGWDVFKANIVAIWAAIKQATIIAVSAVITQINRVLSPLKTIWSWIQKVLTGLRNVAGKRAAARAAAPAGAFGFAGGGFAGARGAIVTRPTLSLIGEGGPEMVVPLDQAPGAFPLGAGGAGGATVVNINIGGDVYALDGNQFGEKIVTSLEEWVRLGGPLPDFLEASIT